jgi:type IV pilus assembly protein PilP
MIAKTMFKQPFIIRNITCLLCFLPLVLGCADPKSEPQPAKKVVSKKISVQQPADTGATQAPAASAEASAEADKDGQGVDSDLTVAAAPELSQDNILAKAAIGYDPKGKIDPFIALVREDSTKKESETAVVATQKVERIKRKPTTPLERIELSQLRLKAIIRSSQGNKALVEEASGKGYIITRGTFIGVNQGTVIDIQKDRVIVEEEIESIQGDITVKTKELRLPKPSGEE